MAATQDQIDQLRRMLGGVATSVYSDVTLGEYIERYPLIDAFGRSPYRANASGLVMEENPFWTAGYDLNSAAAVLWGEIASGLATTKYDFSTDGQSFQRSQMFTQADARARHYAARRAPGTITLTPLPLLEQHTEDEIIEP